MISLNDVLLAMSNIPVDDPIAEIWGRGLQDGYRIIEYTDSLPITINANGDALIDYRIYGADGGVGVATESGEPAGYKLPMTVMDNLAPPLSQWVDGYITVSGTIAPPASAYREKSSDFIEVDPNTKYVFSIEGGTFPQGTNGAWVGIGSYRDDWTFIYRYTSIKNSPYTVSTTSDTKYVRLSYRAYGESLEPRLSEFSFSIPVYIGENQLGEDEYVSYSDGKIYKRTGNLLNSKIIGVAQKIKIEPNTEYVLSRYVSLNDIKIHWAVYNNLDRIIYGLMYMQNDTAMRVPPFSDASYIMITIPEIAYDSVSIVKGTFINTRTAVPATYIPYVAPTDPPVSLPEIPTIDGTTIIDYDGDPKPSQMYVKYNGKG